MDHKLPDISQDFAAWYQEIVYAAQLADQSPVRGSIVIMPYGYAIWELIRDRLDSRIKATGHHNAAFPLLIPESYLKREAEHVEGFAPEVAVVTHAGGKELEEALIVRPTSEVIIHSMFARWLRSWRDLPIKINQWANVVRWEMRPRPFVRTTEFLWQEGHTVHATKEEALEEVLTMLNEYVDLARNYLAIPVVAGIKAESEKFPGAERTYTFEGLMQDGKALQMGTSHLLSQNFAHSFDMKYQDQDGNVTYPWLTSWGATTRLVGAVVMVHGDNKGLVLPPRVAPIQVVIVPIVRKGHDNSPVIEAVSKIADRLKKHGIRVHIDDQENTTPGAKFYHWEMKGVPVRLEIGPRDVANNCVVAVDRLGLGKESLSIDRIEDAVVHLLDRIQDTLLARATERRDSKWYKSAKIAEFGPKLDEQPGFYQTGWCNSLECEQKIKEFKATTRCIIDTKEFSHCFACDKPSVHDVLIAKAY